MIQLVIPTVPVNETLVAELEKMLSAAKAGEVASLGLAWEDSLANSHTFISIVNGVGSKKWGPFMLAVEVLKARVLGAVIDGLVIE